MGSRWDVSQGWYSGAADYYECGRLPYPGALESVFEAAVGRGGRLLDVGCGPGTVGLRLTGLFDELVGVDRDRGMVESARNHAAARNLQEARFLQASAEELPAELGTFRVVVVAQAFHWFDGPRAAEAIFRLLEPGGHCVVLYAWSLSGDPAADSRLPVPPYATMDALVERLGGAGTGTPGTTPDDESGPMEAAGFDGPARWQVPGGDVIMSTSGDLIARWLSRSNAAELRIGQRRAAYTAAAARILHDTSETGFAERLRDAHLNVWTKPAKPRSERDPAPTNPAVDHEQTIVDQVLLPDGLRQPERESLQTMPTATSNGGSALDQGERRLVRSGRVQRPCVAAASRSRIAW